MSPLHEYLENLTAEQLRELTALTLTDAPGAAMQHLRNIELVSQSLVNSWISIDN
jgi:hypothetical protein